MSFLMEHYELTVNLVVCIRECQVFILLCWDWVWDRVKVSSIIYMFLGNESGFFDYFIIHYWIGVVPMCVFLHIKCNNIVSYMINWQ